MEFSLALSWNYKTIYGCQEPSRNRVIVPARQATPPGGIDSVESIHRLLKSLKIWALYIQAFLCVCIFLESSLVYDFAHAPLQFFLYEGKFFSIFIYPWRYDMTTNLFLCSHRQPTIDNVDRQVPSCRYMEKFPIGKIKRGYLIGARCTISKREVFLLRRSHSSTFLYWARICKPFNEPKYRFPGLVGRYHNCICRTRPPGYIGWRNRYWGIYS
jgi:hypothetical protein